MRRKPFFFLFTLVFMAGLFTSAFSAPSPAYQANPTQQQATIEARVNDLFTQTAVAIVNQAATMDALTATAHAIESEIIPTRIALTQTAAVESTVQAEFDQRVTATAAFNATVDARVSELITATAVAASYRGELQIGDSLTTQLENAGGDRWTFQGLAGELALAEMTSDSFIPYMELYDPNNQLVATSTNSGINARLGFALVESGTYTLLARPANALIMGSTYMLTIHMTGITTVEANDFDTYPGGYLVTVSKYEIDEIANTVRLYFEATASQTDLRSPDGTYLFTSSGPIYPRNEQWQADGLTYYSGWLEFDAYYFQYDTGLRLIYCGCGLYEITLSDLRPRFSFPAPTTTPASIVPRSGKWSFTWDQEVVDCPTTQIAYFNFNSAVSASPDGLNMMRTTYGDASASYYLISPGVYGLTASYMDLAATVASETLQIVSPSLITGQRTDIFGDYQDCTVTNSYRMEHIFGG